MGCDIPPAGWETQNAIMRVLVAGLMEPSNIINNIYMKFRFSNIKCNLFIYPNHKVMQKKKNPNQTVCLKVLRWKKKSNKKKVNH